jgi:hypothetical protein
MLTSGIARGEGTKDGIQGSSYREWQDIAIK